MTWIIAHRGDSAHAPENTIEAFTLAIEKQADGIECDIRCTKDGELILFHDATLHRLTSQQREVENLTWKELVGYRVENQPIYSLNDVLPLMRASDIHWWFELKASNAVQPLITWLKNHPELHPYITVISFLRKPLLLLKEELPQLSIGISLEKHEKMTAAKRRHYFEYRISHKEDDLNTLLAFKPDYLCPHYSLIDAELVSHTKQHHIGVIGWTVNDIHKAQALVKLKVDGIMTDDPKRFKQVISC